MPAASAAMPPNPKTAATTAITKKTAVQYSIAMPPLRRPQKQAPDQPSCATAIRGLVRASEGVPRAGQIVASKYEVERVLGTGGMGVVVAARHLLLA